MVARPFRSLLLLSAFGVANAFGDEPCMNPQVSSCTIQNSELATVPGIAAQHDYSATMFCREASCTGRWPIATFDADNVPSRPYACTRVGPYVVGGGKPSVRYFSTAMEREGLAEPRRHR